MPIPKSIVVMRKVHPNPPVAGKNPIISYHALLVETEDEHHKLKGSTEPGLPGVGEPDVFVHAFVIEEHGAIKRLQEILSKEAFEEVLRFASIMSSVVAGKALEEAAKKSEKAPAAT